MKPLTRDDYEGAFCELLHEAGDARTMLSAIDEDLGCADSCETLEDYAANIDSALAQLPALTAHLKEALAMVRALRQKMPGGKVPS